MLSLEKSIVNSHKNLIGFMVGEEFKGGGTSAAFISSRPISIKDLTADGRAFENKQIKVAGGKIYIKEGFKIHDLPMCLWREVKGQGILVDVPNGIRLIASITNNGEQAGYEVGYEAGGSEIVTVERTITLAAWFRPDNFLIRKSKLGRAHICGKGGTILASLPVKEISKRMTRTANDNRKASENIVIPKVGEEVSLLGFIEAVKGLNGYFLRNRQGLYKNLGENDDGIFTPSEEYDIAYPSLKFTENKINASLSFKQLGSIRVPVKETIMDVPCFAWNSKNVCRNATTTIKEIMVVLDKGRASEAFYSAFKDTLITRKALDGQYTDQLAAYGNRTEVDVYGVNLINTRIMTEAEAKNYLLMPDLILYHTIATANSKLLDKYLKDSTGVIGKCKKAVGKDKAELITGSIIHPMYSQLKEEVRIAASNLGVNLYTGAYKADGYEYDKRLPDKTEIEITYKVNGTEPSAYSAEDVENGTTPFPTSSVVNKINAASTDEEKLAKALEQKEENDSKLEESRVTLWKHKCAMVILGGTKIHRHDTQNWKLNTNTRKKSVLVYDCTIPDNWLVMECNNVEI